MKMAPRQAPETSQAGGPQLLREGGLIQGRGRQLNHYLLKQEEVETTESRWYWSSDTDLRSRGGLVAAGFSVRMHRRVAGATN